MKELAKAYASVFFLLGLFVGAGVAIVFTNDETRKKVKANLRKAETKINEAKADIAKKAKTYVKEEVK